MPLLNILFRSYLDNAHTQNGCGWIVTKKQHIPFNIPGKQPDVNCGPDHEQSILWLEVEIEQTFSPAQCALYNTMVIPAAQMGGCRVSISDLPDVCMHIQGAFA